MEKRLGLPQSLPENIKEALERIMRERERLAIDEAYLAGSYARGDWLKDSDLDLVIVSPIFKDLTIGERFRAIKEVVGYGVSLETLCYTQEEFREIKKRSVILQDMLEYAYRII